MKYWKRISIIAIGAVLGFAYYKFIGCRSGVCPITSNPFISTAYGALIGLVLSFNKKEDKKKATLQEHN
ncbi:hypothetical protein B6D60_10980 [candidate division KSB1 bacterium 4484_87]|nr:MAG: hypothetical protein B6D60_10980 [candidate division KSB1 bacterium 4484_87]